ncbi:MAG: hypothetical protein EBS84_18075 [Proteobacteria bacterium]|nr:hypothetical protein [Verrucomicrobiota bacterium]NBU10899.1 hypothetical protein [Pseudomonadota bacterium]
MKHFLGYLLLCALSVQVRPAESAPDRVTAVPAEVRAEFKLADHYQKFISAGGLPVVGSAKVNDVSLLEARFLILQMIGHRPEVLTAMATNKVRFAIMAANEFTTDIPEHSDLSPKLYWDKRARGLGASRTRPAVSCGEENLLCLPGDPYAAENILVHEFAHAVHQMGINALDKTFQARLQATFDAATKAGLWKNKYAGTNPSEYFAEGAQSWFDTNRTNDHDHNHVHLRGQLKEYDPGLAKLCEEVFGDRAWRYARPAARQPASPHFAGFDAAKAGKFAWPRELTEWQEKFRRGEVTMAPADAIALAPHTADEQPSWRSATGGARAELYFQNARQEPVLLFWVDNEGAPHYRSKLRPAEHTQMTSFGGHLFRVTDEQTNTLHYFIAAPKPGSAVIK